MIQWLAAWLRGLIEDARDLDPEVRKERVKLVVGVLAAAGVAAFIGSTIAPFLDPARALSLPRGIIAAVLGGGCVLFALWLLRYIKPRE